MNSFLSFRCPANRSACLPFATGRDYVAHHPCFYSVQTWTRVGGRLSHTLEQILEPRSHGSHGRGVLLAMQTRATAQFQDSHAEKSWRSTTAARARHAFPGQGDPGSPRDTTHPTQHKRLVSKRREKRSYFASFTNETLGLVINKGGLGLFQEVKIKSVFYYCRKCSYATRGSPVGLEHITPAISSFVPGRRAGREEGRAVWEGVCVTARQRPLTQRSSFLSF